MRNKFIYGILFFLSLNLFICNVSAQPENDSKFDSKLGWWLEARFGLFIHWGLYSLPARHEKVIRNEQISSGKYKEYMHYFNPDLYDPTEWAKIAKKAGMKYAVLTAKHHDGFCLWDTKQTDFKVTNTPYKKDIIKEYVDAFRKEGLKVGLYYSIIDWTHEDFTVDDRHALNYLPNRDELNKDRDMSKYRDYMQKQVTELLSNYGKIDVLFMDYAYPHLKDGKGRDDFGSVELLKIIRTLQPDLILNDRMDLLDHEDGWDYRTPEQFMPKEWVTYNNKIVPWETCQTFYGSWGYKRDEYTWKSSEQLITMLIESVSKGGNLLLNVGPNGRGYIEPRSVKLLNYMSDWMKYNSRSIYGCTQAPKEFTTPNNCLLTYNAKLNRIYVHLLHYPFKNLILENFEDKVTYAQFLHDASEINKAPEGGPWMSDTKGFAKGNLVLELPVVKPDVEIPVIELFLK